MAKPPSGLKRGRPPKTRFQFGVTSDTPFSAKITAPNPYANVVATTPRLRRLEFHYEKETKPISLKSGGVVQPALLKGSIAERVEIDVNPRTGPILGTYDYPITLGKEHPRTQVGLIIRDTDSPKVSHLESFYPGHGLRQEIVYDLLKKQDKILINTPTPKANEPMGAEYINPKDEEAARIGMTESYLASRGGRIPMKITRAGFEAVHIPNEVAEEEGPLNPNVLPMKDRTPVDIVPREIGWEYKRTETPGGYVKHVTGQTEHSHPQIVKKYLPAKVSEGFTPPDEKEAEGIVEKRMPGAVKPWAGVSKITLRDVPNKYNPGAVNIKTKGVFLGDKQVGTLDYYPEEGDIAQIEIDEKYQRRGIGREAVWHALNESKTTDAEGNPTHSISGESSLDAQRFWRGIGAGVYRGRFEGPDTLPTISLDRSDFEAVQLKLGKKDLGAKGAPLYPHETYPSEPSVKTPRFMQMDEGRYPKAGSSGGRPYIVDYERPYFDAPSKFRFSINVDDKPVPTDYFGWHPIEVPEKGKGAKGYTTLRRASGERPSPTVQIEPNKDEFYLKRLEKERAHQGELWDRAEAKNKEYRAIGGKTRYMINTDDFPREHYIDVSTHRYTPRAKVDLVGTLAMTDAVFDRKNKVAVPMFLTKVKESPPPGNPRYTHKGGHSSLFGITLFRTQGDKPAESIPIHEVAHQIHGALPEAEKMEWTDIHGASLPSDLPSVYASKNKNEDFAESYVAFVGGKKLDTHRQQFMERIASRYNLPAKENFEERFKVPVEYRAPEMKAEELPDVSEKEPESKITTLARATWLSEHPGLHTAVEQKEKQSSTLPSELIIEPTDEEIPIEEKPAFEFSIESPLGKPVRKSERQPEEESAGYSGSEEEINKEAESLYGGEEGG